MAVYVDDVRHQFGRMKMCHMWADSLAELLTMVDNIGIKRKWLQCPPAASWIHFDICLQKKKIALKLGAILTDKYGPLEFLAKQDLLSNDANKIANANINLNRILKMRNRLIE